MKLRYAFFAVFTAAQFFLTFDSWAMQSSDSSKVVEKRVVADTPERFANTEKQIRDEMGKGGRYEFIRGNDKVRAEADLTAIAMMLQKSGSVDAMSQDDKVQLFNTQEHLNGILTHSDRNRLVCEKQAPLGTILPVTSCRTVGEIERNRANSATYLRDSEQKLQDVHPCAGPSCGH